MRQPTFGELEVLKLSKLYLLEEACILQLRGRGGTIASRWSYFNSLLSEARRRTHRGTTRPFFFVSTNGVKKNGHLFIQHILSKYAICCAQETHFRNRQRLDTFQFT